MSYGRRRRRLRRVVGAMLLLGVIGYFAWDWINVPRKSADEVAAVAGDANTSTTPSAPPAPSQPSILPPKPIAVPKSDTPRAPVPDTISNVPASPPAPGKTAPGSAVAPGSAAATAPTVGPILTANTPASAAPPAAAAQPPAEPTPTIRSGGETARLIQAGRELLAQNQLLKARETLSRALLGDINARDAELVRNELTGVNQKLVFSPAVEPGDPLCDTYVVQPGDSLVKIARSLKVPWQFIKLINNIQNDRGLRLGARLKVVKGPFRIVVHKRDFRLDVWQGDLYIRSFTVGLGEFDSTPPGEWVVRGHSKLENPPWINPRTGQRFEADDPKNPLGEYWIGIRGADAETQKFSGYGIHGTIYPDTIGQMASMGCVRLLADDIKMVYAMLEEEHSRVTIVN